MFKKKLSLLLLPVVATLSLQAADPFNDPFFNDPFGDDIFKEMMQMQKNMDKMFERMQHRMNQRSSGLVSPLGTYKMAVQNQLVDKGDHYELTTNIPESKENHIDINTANGMMNITAKVVQEKEEKSQYGVSQSRSVRMYQQSTSLPADADDSAISTTYENGKLVVKIGKKKGGAKALAAPVTKTEVTKPTEKVIVPKANYEKKPETKKEENSSVQSVPEKKTIHSDTPSMS
jgi:HSP20 family molecular chaperone IbpA